MIIVQLQGGLGNQMFQYAAGRALALRNKTELKIDVSFLRDAVLGENVAYRNYGLNNFIIDEKIIDDSELEQFKKKALFYFKMKFSWLNKKLSYRIPIPTIYSQKGHGYNQEFNKLSKNTFLSGYWQNIKYFEGYENQIRNDFKFKNLPDNEAREIIKTIINSESVAVHIRRGDFKNLALLGTTETNYYIKAIHYMMKKLKKPVLYFFSDEINWVKENFNESVHGCRSIFVDINYSTSNEANDLHIMTYCKHNIIGNSTYGWWGAWLNNNSEKIIISPKKLFNDPVLDSSLQGMIPENWVRF